MKPIAPLLALPCSGMKPPSPLRAMKGHFCAISTLQRCWWFQSCPVIACYARNSSPYAAWNGCVCEIVRPARPGVGVSAKKFALHDQNMRKTVFSAALGEVFRGAVAEWAVLGEVFRGTAAGRAAVGELFRGRVAEGAHGERVYVRPQPLWPSLISRGPISHAIPLKVFQVMNSNR